MESSRESDLINFRNHHYSERQTEGHVENVNVVIVATYRPAELRLSIASVLREFAISEIYILNNGASPTIQEVIDEFISTSHASVKWHVRSVENRLGPAAARNVLLRDKILGWTLFLDDDAFLPIGYGTKFAQIRRENPHARVLGGPNLNPDKGHSFAENSSIALGTFWGSGPFYRRYQKAARRPGGDCDFILCQLWINLEEETLFEIEVMGGEENLLIRKLQNLNWPMVYDGQLFAWHSRRKSWTTFFAQIFKYGLGRAEVSARDKRQLIILFALPTLPLLAVAIFALLFGFNFGDGLKLIFGLYFLFNVIVTTWISLRQKKWREFPALFSLFISIHFAYFLGVYGGLIKIYSDKAALSKSTSRATAISDCSR